MNDLSVDIGYKSINHYGEYLCGDHVDVVQQENNDSKVVVLADGLKSGVKASILSTLTANIISTMMAHGLSLDECVNTRWGIIRRLRASSTERKFISRKSRCGKMIFLSP